MDEEAVRREVEVAAEAITERMRAVVDGLEELQTTYYERFHKVSVRTWSLNDLRWLVDNGIDYRSVLTKGARSS